MNTTTKPIGRPRLSSGPRQTVSTTLAVAEVELCKQLRTGSEKFGATIRRLILRGATTEIAERLRAAPEAVSCDPEAPVSEEDDDISF